MKIFEELKIADNKNVTRQRNEHARMKLDKSKNFFYLSIDENKSSCLLSLINLVTVLNFNEKS